MDFKYTHCYVFPDLPEIFAIFTKMTVNKITNCDDDSADDDGDDSTKCARLCLIVTALKRTSL